MKKSVLLPIACASFLLFSQFVMVPWTQSQINSHLMEHDGGWNISSIVYAVLVVVFLILFLYRYRRTTMWQRALWGLILLSAVYYCWVLKGLYCLGCAVG